MFHNLCVKFLAIIICCNFSTAVSCREVNIDQFIGELPQSERKELEDFFRFLITAGDFGYTLFGAKPVSMDAWSMEPSISYLFFPFINNEIILKKGWSVWAKYSHLFQGTRFWLRATSHGKGAIAIYLINTETASTIIENHLEVFKKYLGMQITANDILKGFEKDESILDQTLSGNEELLGILLGYGAMNSQKFQKYSALTDIKNRLPIFPKQLDVKVADDSLGRKMQRMEWKSSESSINQTSRVEIDPELVERELMSIKWERWSKNEDPLAQIYLPAFRRIEDDPEGERLIQEFRVTRPKIISILNSQDFLKIVLSEISK